MTLGSAWRMVLCHHSRSVVSVPERQVPWMRSHVSRDQLAGLLTKLTSIKHHYADRTAFQLTMDQSCGAEPHCALHMSACTKHHSAMSTRRRSGVVVLDTSGTLMIGASSSPE